MVYNSIFEEPPQNEDLNNSGYFWKMSVNFKVLRDSLFVLPEMTIFSAFSNMGAIF
jgi:hypothetical protein